MSELVLRELTVNDESAFLQAYRAWEDQKGFVFAAGYTPDIKFTDYLQQLSDLKNGKNLPRTTFLEQAFLLLSAQRS